MAMYDLNLLSNDNVPENWEEGKDSWEGRLAVDDEERDVVNFEAIREVSDAGPPFVCVRDDNHLVPSVDQLCGELVDVAFNATWLWKEAVADHRDIVRHGGSCRLLCNLVRVVAVAAENQQGGRIVVT
jgi:hypothetical protein